MSSDPITRRLERIATMRAAADTMEYNDKTGDEVHFGDVYIATIREVADEMERNTACRGCTFAEEPHDERCRYGLGVTP